MPPRDPQAHKAAGKRFRTLNAFCDRGIVEADLSPSEVAVWLILYRHGNPDQTSSVSIEGIVNSTGLAERTVKLAMKNLKAKKMVKTIRKGGIGRGASIYVFVPYPPPPKSGAKNDPLHGAKNSA